MVDLLIATHHRKPIYGLYVKVCPTLKKIQLKWTDLSY